MSTSPVPDLAHFENGNEKKPVMNWIKWKDQEPFDSRRGTACPTAVLLRQHSGWTYGILANQLVSTGGTRGTEDVNATVLQPFLSYTTKTYTTFLVNTESTYDWESGQWTAPVNVAVAQLLKLGGQPMQFQIGPKLYVEGPTGAPDWGIRFAYTLLFPR